MARKGRGRSRRVGRVGARRAQIRSAKKSPNPYLDDAKTLSAQFVADVRERWGAKLGRDLDAVRVLDRVLGFIRQEGAGELVLPAGFYFGELLRRAYDGEYAWSPIRKALGLKLSTLVVYPIETVRRVLEEPGARPLEEVLMVLAKRLSEAREGEAGGG
jgi:hypothetical protein